MKTWISILLGVLLLSVAVATQLVGPTENRPGKGLHLAGALPVRIPGWESHALTLGPSEAAAGQVEEVLKFDDVFFREYARGATRFSVYVAYWNPGKMPVQLVASHTPDRCWVENGWVCDSKAHDVRVEAEGMVLVRGQGRVFHDRDGQLQHVIYWHLVGDRLFDFDSRVSTIPDPWKWLREMAKQPFTAPREQYFIRLTSDHPFPALESDAGFQELVRALGRLGLARR